MTWRPGPAWLFCPADRPDRWAKAAAVADVVIVDLEDAVAPAGKAAARDAVRAGGFDPERTVLRINAAGTPDHDADLALLAGTPLRRVMLAKAEDPAALAALDAFEVLALVESPLGVERVGELAAVAHVVGVMWGADDLVAGLGGLSSRHADGRYRDVARHARSRALVAAKAHGRLAIDAVHMDIADVEGLRAECEDAVAVGFDATVAIHPSQVEVIRGAYRPDDERVAWAGRLLEAVGDDRGVTTFEGRMVDGPIFRQAERVLRLAGR
ncbi:CoA ester lyase [Blastococcus sp. URHD0036]|uniref:HpcH/HpaI aldolase/citrate lyase family protein n=1 Tax=Blastococcus sp. URHD0036 TaxID=1380356 RepID=UPI00049718BB|nr:CoA ester lyase [Blastococcus sp. URHD0036]